MAGQTGTQENVLTCNECGATIYKEHLDKKLAGFHAGKLLCVFCLKQHKGGGPRPPEEKPAVPSVAAAAADEGDLPPIALVDELEAPEAPPQRTSHGTSMGTTVTPAAAEEPTRYSRALNKTGGGATRCRTFHCKLSDEAARHLDGQINEWLDRNPDIEIKFCTSTVGVWTGKHAEPNLIINVFY